MDRELVQPLPQMTARRSRSGAQRGRRCPAAAGQAVIIRGSARLGCLWHLIRAPSCSVLPSLRFLRRAIAPCSCSQSWEELLAAEAPTVVKIVQSDTDRLRHSSDVQHPDRQSTRRFQARENEVVRRHLDHGGASDTVASPPLRRPAAILIGWRNTCPASRHRNPVPHRICHRAGRPCCHCRRIRPDSSAAAPVCGPGSAVGGSLARGTARLGCSFDC